MSERTPKRYTPEQQLMKVAIVVLIFPILVTSLSYLSVPLSLLAQKVFPKTVADAISVSGSLIVGVGGASTSVRESGPSPRMSILIRLVDLIGFDAMSPLANESEQAGSPRKPESNDRERYRHHKHN